MPLPSDLYDKGVAYRIRICLLVEENPIIGLLTASIVQPCDGCERFIWVKEDQEIPPMPPDYAKEYKGDLNLCKFCMRDAQANDPNGGEPLFLRPQDQLAWQMFGDDWVNDPKEEPK